MSHGRWVSPCRLCGLPFLRGFGPQRCGAERAERAERGVLAVWQPTYSSPNENGPGSAAARGLPAHGGFCTEPPIQPAGTEQTGIGGEQTRFRRSPRPRLVPRAAIPSALQMAVRQHRGEGAPPRCSQRPPQQRSPQQQRAQDSRRTGTRRPPGGAPAAWQTGGAIEMRACGGRRLAAHSCTCKNRAPARGSTIPEILGVRVSSRIRNRPRTSSCRD